MTTPAHAPNLPFPLAPAYYWAGEGSAIIHRLKGFNRGVDHEAYVHAYDAERIRWLRDVGRVNCLFLSYNWGLPPELERVDWRDFERATRICHELGMLSIAYVQPSNAAAIGSFAERSWYAVTPKGKRIPYYNGRFFTCLHDPLWRESVQERALDAIARGADGVFLDNCAFGGMPIPLSSDYTAFAGCYCSRCQASFARWQKLRGQPPAGIPRLFRPARDRRAREFAHWRAWSLLEFIREIRSAIRSANANAVLLTNTVGAVNVNTYNIFGVDLPELAHVVDWMFVENLQSPRAEPGLLVQNAGTYKLLNALKPGAPTLSIAYERGIGVDNIPPSTTFQRIAAEAYAAGGSPVLRVAEYIEGDRWTLLQPGKHDSRVGAAGAITRFVAENPSIFRHRTPAARVVLYVPPGLAWRGDAFPESGSDYLAVLQALVAAAIPFRVETSLARASDAAVLLVPAGIPSPDGTQARVIRYDELGIEKRRRSLFDYFGERLEPLIRSVGPRVIDGYYSRVHVRRFVDRLDLLFRLVFKDQFEPLALGAAAAETLVAANPVRIEADGFIFADLWENTNSLQLHLVNYESRSVRVHLTGPGGPCRVTTTRGQSFPSAPSLSLESYAVLEWAKAVIEEPTPGATAVR